MDVTERKRAEEAVLRSEKELRNVIDTIPAVVWSALPDGSNTYVNRRFVEYSGMSGEQMAGSGWQAAVHPDDLQRHVDKWRASVGTGEPHENEATFPPADGQYRWHLDRGLPLRDEQGNILKWYGITMEIEDRKRAEEAVRASEASLLDAQRLTRTCSWRHEVLSGKVTVSAEGRAMYGIEPEDDASSVDFYFGRMHPKDRPEVEQAYAAALLRKTGFEADFRIVFPDGTIKNTRSIGHPILDERGDVVEFVGAAIDVTERKQAEQRLIVEHTVTQMLATGATLEEVTPKILQTVCELLFWDVGTLWSIDREAGVLRCAEVWHDESVEVPQFEAICRQHTFMPGVGLPGRVWSSHEPAYIPDVAKDPIFPRGPIAARAGLHACFAFPILLGADVLGVIEFFSHEIRQPDQELLDMMATLGSQIGQFIERKRAEEAFRTAQMELAHVTRVATLGEMTASIAHEINQPLGALVNNAGACLGWLDAENLEEARNSVALMMDDAQRASEIITRIRALVKKAPPQKDWLDINQIIREVIGLGAERSATKSYRVRDATLG